MIKKYFITLFLFAGIFANKKNYAQQLKYTIHADLSREEHVLKATQFIDVKNNSRDSFYYLWLYLYPNAFKNDKSAYTDYSLLNRDMKYYFSRAAERSNFIQLNFRAEDKQLFYQKYKESEELIKLFLHKPLLPGDSIVIHNYFELKLPALFDSLGYCAEKYMLTLWHPLVAAYTSQGWNIDEYTTTKKTELPLADYEIVFDNGAQQKRIVENNIPDVQLIIDSSIKYSAKEPFYRGKNYWIKGGLQKPASRHSSVFERYFRRIFLNKVPKDTDKFLLQSYEQAGKGQPVVSSKLRSEYEIYLFEETKASLWYEKIKNKIGEDHFYKAVNELNALNKVVDESELKQVFGKNTNQNLNDEFVQLHTSASLYAEYKKKLKPTFLFNFRETDKYNYLSFAPAVGYNYYDKFMPGIIMHNYQLPLNKFHFLTAPLYSVQNRKLTGLARAEYNIFKPKHWLQFSLSGSRFAFNEVSIPQQGNYSYEILRLVPSAKFTLYQNEATFKKWTFQLKDYFLQSSSYRFEQLENSDEIKVSAGKATTNVFEFTTKFDNGRILYPYNFSLTMHTKNNFLRAGITGNYFFNYDATGRGLKARAYFGKFFYLVKKSINAAFETLPYHLYLSNTSVSDFTFNNYFIGRNEQNSWMNRQTFERDGFFKVATPLYSEPIGRSDNWIGSLNFTADIPAVADLFMNTNFKMPVKIFIDVGTFENAWSDRATTGKFVYDAGVQLSFLNNAVNVYIPLLYSKVYKDYYRSIYGKNFFDKTISFSIDFNKLKPKILNTILPL